MKQILPLLFVLVTTFSCTDRRSFFAGEHKSSKEIQFNNIALEKIVLDTVPSSFVGQSGITTNGNIYFMDELYTKKFDFDTTGKFITSTLGKGRARNETTVGIISTHNYLPNGDFLILGYTLDFYTYDQQFMLKNTFRIHHRPIDDDIPNQLSTYPLYYLNLVSRSFGDKLYLNAQGGRPEFNPVTTPTDEYLLNAYNIKEVDLDKKDYSKLLAKGYPESYFDEPKTKRILSGVTFDIDRKGNFYVSYEADSLIYVYDNDFKPLVCYGYEGVNMDTNYIAVGTLKEAGTNYQSERSNKGYYNWIEYDDATKTLFRSYQKGAHSDFDGLQIYRNNTLIADVEVPKGVKIAGYVAPYYYTDIISDEDNCKMTAYRFKL